MLFSRLLLSSGVLAALALIASADRSWAASHANADLNVDFLVTETELTHPHSRDRYVVYAGEYDSEKGYEAFQKFLNERVQSARAQNPDVYIEVQAFEENSREPQAHNPRLPNLFRPKYVATQVGKALQITVKPAVTLTQRFSNWYHHGQENRIRLSFTLISASIDGVSNALAMAIGAGASAADALIIGGTVAALSGSWSLFTPQIAKLLNGNPSLVERIIKKKTGFIYTGAKWAEGLFKWGILQFVYVGSVGAGSAALGLAHFNSVGDWALTTTHAASMITAGQGLFDFSLSIELNRDLQSADEAFRKKALIKNYALGTTAASAAALGAIASIGGMDFGGMILNGLLGAGVINLARIQKDSILEFTREIGAACGQLLKPRTLRGLQEAPSYPSWGSE